MTGKFVSEISSTYLRRVALVFYVPIGLLYNVLYYYPKHAVLEAYWWARVQWQHREQVNVFIHEGQASDVD